MNTKEVLDSAALHLKRAAGHVFDVLTLSKPISTDAAVDLAKIVSKLSPLLGNLIEFNTVELLNEQPEYKRLGAWKRQDPGFPDAVFQGSVVPTPGLEIKAWFPLATEITARFRDSQSHFIHDQTYVCLLAWLPEMVIFGKPYVVDTCIISARSVAKARDLHYHNPPDYLVLEPEDTSARTRNLQQTNTAGYKFQGSRRELSEAEKIVASWGKGGKVYKRQPAYQAQLRQLFGRFKYRLDTNFAKMDRIAHSEIEDFKERVLETQIHGLPITAWSKLLYAGSDADIRAALEDRLGLKASEP